MDGQCCTLHQKLGNQLATWQPTRAIQDFKAACAALRSAIGIDGIVTYSFR